MAFAHTIRFKLTVWFAGTLTCIMLISGFFWERHLAALMMGNVDERLRQFVVEIDKFHRRGHRLAPHSDVTLCGQLKDFVRNYNWGIYVQQLDASGEVQCTTQNLGELHIPAGRELLSGAAAGEQVFSTFQEFRGGRVRVLTYAVHDDNGQLLDYIQIGKDLTHNDENLQSLRWTLLLYAPVLILGLGACGWILAARALAPVAQISAAIRKISAERLNERLPIDSKPNELSQLSASFNEMLERLADSFNRIRQFSADASHELRTPLAILKGETEVALRWSRDMDELRACLASNLEEIDRLERIIEDLLCLAKSEAGELRLTLSTFSLSDLMQDLYLLGNTLGEPKEIAVTLWLNVEKEIFITADQMQVHRALLNLLSNAIKYTPDGGSVELTLDVTGSEAQIAVRDTGFGIPEQHLPHIFERFYRVDEARNRQAGGTGLGLAIVKAIVAAHKGEITVTSSVGSGSVFTIRFPLAGPQPLVTGD